MPIDKNLYKTAGAQVLRGYLLSRLVAEQFIDLNDYPYPPFVPTQVTQDLAESSGGKPFVVYNYTKTGYVDEWWLCSETMAMRIYSDEEEDIRMIQNYLVKLLGRADWTASNINDWITESGTTLQKKFEFKTSQILSMISPEEYVSQDGRQAGVVVVRYDYTLNIDNDHFGGLLV